MVHEELSLPRFSRFILPGQRKLPCFCCCVEPSSPLMTVMFPVPVSNRRKDMSGKAARIRLTEKQRYLDILDFVEWARENVPIEDDEVGQLSFLQRSLFLLLLLERHVRTVDGSNPS